MASKSLGHGGCKRVGEPGKFQEVSNGAGYVQATELSPR